MVVAKRHIALFLVRGSRALFVLSTISIAVVGARVASDFSDMGWWLILAGSAIVFFCSDLGSEYESQARKLALASESKIRKTRLDILGDKFAGKVVDLFAFGLLMIALGIIVRCFTTKIL